ncbi:MAG: hypothetical protein V1743_03940 [Nanoarchaeota archaeon]
MNTQNQTEQKPLEILIVEDNPRFLAQAFNEYQRRMQEHGRPMHVYFATDYNQAHWELLGDPIDSHGPTKYDGVLTDVFLPVIEPGNKEEEDSRTQTAALECSMYLRKAGIDDDLLQKLGLEKDAAYTYRTTDGRLLPCGLPIAELARSQGIPAVLVTNKGGHGGTEGIVVVRYAIKRGIYCIDNEMTERYHRNIALTGDYRDHSPEHELVAISKGKKKDWQTAFDTLLDLIDGVDIKKRFDEKWKQIQEKNK